MVGAALDIPVELLLSGMCRLADRYYVPEFPGRVAAGTNGVVYCLTEVTAMALM